MYFIGVDLGGTQLRVGIVSEAGELLERKSEPTNAHEGPERVISRLMELIREISEPIVKENGNDSIGGIGMGCPGTLDVFHGVVKSSPNLPGWDNIPLRQLLEQQFSWPVYINNDANAAVLGEYYFGKGKGCDNLIYMTISTGVGAGIIENGKLLLGENGQAAEIGHMILNPFGPVCGCKNLGCFEAYVSGTGIVKRTKKLLEDDLRKSILHNEQQLTTKVVFEAACAGDELALEIVDETRKYLGVALVNLIHLFNPKQIIFGGGVSQVGDFLFKPAIDFAKEKVMYPMAENVLFSFTELGDNVGLLGAASLVKYHKDFVADFRLNKN